MKVIVLHSVSTTNIIVDQNFFATKEKLKDKSYILTKLDLKEQ